VTHGRVDVLRLTTAARQRFVRTECPPVRRRVDSAAHQLLLDVVPCHGVFAVRSLDGLLQRVLHHSLQILLENAGRNTDGQLHNEDDGQKDSKLLMKFEWVRTFLGSFSRKLTVIRSVGDSLIAPKQPSEAIRNMIRPVTMRTIGGARTRPSTK